MVEAINQIGHVMGKHIIAEYVETEALMQALGRMGVDYGQGFGIALPSPFSHDYRSGVGRSNSVRSLRLATLGSV